MPEKNPEEFVRLIITKAKEFGADLSGVANIDDLKRSPSHLISEKMPEFGGVGTKAVEGRKRGVVEWPDGARSAIVIALAHPPDKPELDWWVTTSSSGNTPGNFLLMAVIDKLAAWLEDEHGVRCFKLPYHIEHGAVFMKDAAVLAGLGCIGENNVLVTPEYGACQRLRVMLTDLVLPSSGPVDYDPCADCPMPCQKACPQGAFAEKIYSEEEYGIAHLPGRRGVYSRVRCNQEMNVNNADFETVDFGGQEKPGRRVKYCRECELACPVGNSK